MTPHPPAARMTPQEWEDFKKRTGYQDPEGERIKEVKKMAELERIQYYATDLSYALDIGEIADMHVETLDSGVQVLRMSVVPKKRDEYKTVKVAPKKEAIKQAQRKQNGLTGHGPGPKAPQVSGKEPVDIGKKLVDYGKKFMSNKNKPPWME